MAGFTARSVAREAQTSTPAVYELFGDKGGLIRELFFEGFRLLRRHLEVFVETEDPRVGNVIQIVELYRGFIRENRVLSEVMFAHLFTDFEASRSELRAAGAVRSFIVERVRRCIDAGLMHGDEADTTGTDRLHSGPSSPPRAPIGWWLRARVDRQVLGAGVRQRRARRPRPVGAMLSSNL